jgi:dihydropteroate synthase
MGSALALADLPRVLPPSGRLYLRPVGLLQGDIAMDMCAAGRARPLAGGPLAFPVCEIVIRARRQVHRAAAEIPRIETWSETCDPELRRNIQLRLELLTVPRAAMVQLPALMGVINVTPDSFSDAGERLDPDAALAHGLQLAASGARILDIGGESTRPGATPVDAKAETDRVEPVLARLSAQRQHHPGLLLSIDTRHAAVMRCALAYGVDIINDVSALSDDPQSLATAAASKAAVVLMHKQGDPASMNVSPRYEDVALDVFDQLEARIEACAGAGIEQSRLIVDPGIGFGKRSEENLALLRSLALYHGLGSPLLVGFSRKALLGGEQGRLTPRDRLPGSLAAAMHALDKGVQLLRVHDVAETRQVVDLWSQINQVG